MTKEKAAELALNLLYKAQQYIKIVDGDKGYVLGDALSELIEGLEWVAEDKE